ncbi:MAG: PASTA domain-containing protein [Armatimonadota bacterium]|nr:PASTA domain-containing protein [Armatimonadota bacterium]
MDRRVEGLNERRRDAVDSQAGHDWEREVQPSADGAGRVLISRRRQSDGLDRDELRERVDRACRLRHPGLCRVTGVRIGDDGVQVMEELGRARRLDDPRCRLPRGGRLEEGLLGVLEALAYLQRNGLVHGRVSADTLVSDGRGIYLTGAALAGGRSEEPEAAGRDVRQWAEVARETIDRSGRAGADAGAVRRAGAGLMRDADGPVPGAPQAASRVRQVWAKERLAADRHSRTTDGPDGIMNKVIHFTASLLLGMLTTILTAAVIAGAVAAGALWFLDRLPQQVPVPNVVGMPMGEARERLGAAGLGVGDIRRVYRSDHPAGEVAATMPEPGMTVRQGRELTLVVSQGAAQVRVPRLIGLEVQEARRLLKESGLGLAASGQTRSPAPEGEIVWQDPSPGGKAARGERVSVKTSGGPEYGQVRVKTDDGDTVPVLFRRIEVVVPMGDPLQRVKILEGYRSPLDVGYDRLHRPGDRIEFDTYGRAGKRIEVWIEGERAYRTRL